MYWIIAGYTIPLLYCFFAWKRAKSKVKVFQAAWVWGIMFMLNAYGVIYYKLFNESKLPLGVSIEKYVSGSLINLSFLIAWSVGYFIFVSRNIYILKKSKYKNEVSELSKRALKLLLVLSSISTIFYYSLGVSYGETVFDYSSLPVYFGVVSAFKSLFLPTVATYLILIDKVTNQKSKIQKNTVEKLLWSFVLLRAIAGFTLDMQRGDIVYPFLAATIVLVVKGYVMSRKKIVITVVTAGILIITASPILDILRSPAVYNKNLSISNVLDAATRVSESTGNELLSASTLMYVPYSKSILPSSTHSLSKKASEDGYIYFETYDDIIIDLVPRFIWPNKPWPLSVNGKRTGMSAGVAAKNLGMDNILWVMGGGTMYWQFGWLGVLLGGLIVGTIWGIMTQKMLLSSSPFLIIIYMSLLGWGINYVSSVDKVMLDILRQVRALSLVWFPILIAIEAARRSKKD